MMGLKAAASFFNTTPVDGWLPLTAAWQRRVAKGTLQVYDRFISDRVFGERKRVFTLGDQKTLGAYKVIRTPDDKVWLVESNNTDVVRGRVYNTVYQLREASTRVEIWGSTTTLNAAQMPVKSAPALQATVWGDYERFSSGAADEFIGQNRELEQLYLEAGTVVLPESVLKFDGMSFRPKSISRHADLTFCRVERIK